MKRYDWNVPSMSYLKEDLEGEWVRFEDVEAALAAAAPSPAAEPVAWARIKDGDLLAIWTAEQFKRGQESGIEPLDAQPLYAAPGAHPAPTAQPGPAFDEAMHRSGEYMMPLALHPETARLVMRFAFHLSIKLRKAERKYGYTDGWRRDDWMEECQKALAEHVAKGDPLDVAAYCAFCMHHGWLTSAPMLNGLTASEPKADPSEPAPPNSLPDWDECAMRVANSNFIEKRIAEGGYGAEHDTKLASQLHRFIYEYDDSDPYRSAWFLHRLELLINEARAASKTAETASVAGLTEPKQMKCPYCDEGTMSESGGEAHRVMLCGQCGGCGVTRAQVRANRIAIAASQGEVLAEPSAATNDRECEREEFYRVYDESTKLTGHKPAPFDIWLMARGCMDTSHRTIATPARDAGLSDEQTQPWYDQAWASGAKRHLSFAGDDLDSLSFTPETFESFCIAILAAAQEKRNG